MSSSHGGNKQVDQCDQHKQKIDENKNDHQCLIADVSVGLVEVSDADCQAEEEEMRAGKREEVERRTRVCVSYEVV